MDMNQIFQKKTRKSIVEYIEGVTGERALYTKLPRCAYIIRGIVLERDGTVSFEDDADEQLLELLLSEGYFQAETTDIEEQEHESDFERYDELIESPPKIIRPEIRFPLNEHRAASLQNLVFTIYSKGSLISKATGGRFEVSDELVERLLFDSPIFMNDVLDILRRAEGKGLIGLRFDDEDVIFSGFSETNDSDVIKAWTDLAALINQTAIKQGHVHAKRTEGDNEKFGFRSWLIRLDMNGPLYKKSRNILYKKLEGNTAFRTPAHEEKWKRRRAALKEKLAHNKENS